MSTNKRWGKTLGLWLVLVIGVVLIVDLSRGIINLLSSRERVVEAEERVVSLEEEKERLEKLYDEQLSDEYIEMEIRNKLQMSMPGEVVILLPEMEVEELVEEEEMPADFEVEPWRKWLALFY